MTTPKVLIGRVTNVQPHPDNDKLRNKMDIVTVSGKTNVANRPSPDQPRYKVGDYAAMLTENLILPDWLLKHLDLWDDEKNKGILAGAGNRLKPRALGLKNKILSEVALCAITWTQLPDAPFDVPFDVSGFASQCGSIVITNDIHCVINKVVKIGITTDISPEGHNVAALMGIEEQYEAQNE